MIFEAPGRTAGTAAGPGRARAVRARRAALCRELTKRFEEVRRGTLAELSASLGERPVRGEVTLVVAGATAHAEVPARLVADLAAGRRRVADLVAGGMRRPEAARTVAAETGLPRRELFSVAGVAAED